MNTKKRVSKRDNSTPKCEENELLRLILSKMEQSVEDGCNNPTLGQNELNFYFGCVGPFFASSAFDQISNDAETPWSIEHCIIVDGELLALHYSMMLLEDCKLKKKPVAGTSKRLKYRVELEGCLFFDHQEGEFCELYGTTVKYGAAKKGIR